MWTPTTNHDGGSGQGVFSPISLSPTPRLPSYSINLLLSFLFLKLSSLPSSTLSSPITILSSPPLMMRSVKCWYTYCDSLSLFFIVVKSIGCLMYFLYVGNCLKLTGLRNGHPSSCFSISVSTNLIIQFRHLKVVLPLQLLNSSIEFLSNHAFLL